MDSVMKKEETLVPMNQGEQMWFAGMKGHYKTLGAHICPICGVVVPIDSRHVLMHEEDNDSQDTQNNLQSLS